MTRQGTASIALYRAALGGDDQDFRRLAEQKIRRATNAPTVKDTAEELGVTPRALLRLRVDFPMSFPKEWR